MVLNVTFNFFSVISWQSGSMVVETRVSEKTTDMSKVTDKLYSIMFDRVDFAISGIQTRNFSGDKQ
jgi:hypothetical protein